MTKFDPTKPARTRDGRKVEILPRRLSDGALIVVVKGLSGYEGVHSFYPDGNFLQNSAHELDLENIPEHKSFFCNVYRDFYSGKFILGNLYVKDEAKLGNPTRIAQLELIFDGETLLEVKVKPNFAQILSDKIPF